MCACPIRNHDGNVVECGRCGAMAHGPSFWRVLPMEEWSSRGVFTVSPVVTTVNAKATPTFAIFVTGTNFVRFQDARGVPRGSTSVDGLKMKWRLENKNHGLF